MGREGDDRGWDGWMALLTRWTWVWTSSRSWWWTGKPGILQSMGSQRVGHDWVMELNWTGDSNVWPVSRTTDSGAHVSFIQQTLTGCCQEPAIVSGCWCYHNSQAYRPALMEPTIYWEVQQKCTQGVKGHNIAIKGTNTLPWWRMKGRGDQLLIRWLARASPGSWVLKTQSWEPSENFPRRGENTPKEMRGKEASLL